MINHNENEDEDEKQIDHIDTTWTGLGLEINTNILNIKSISVWWCLYALSNT